MSVVQNDVTLRYAIDRVVPGNAGDGIGSTGLRRDQFLRCLPSPVQTVPAATRAAVCSALDRYGDLYKTQQSATDRR